LFIENLHGILQDIYLMVTKMYFSPEYVENLSPAERQMYIKYYLKELQEKAKKQKNTGVSLPPEELMGVE